LILRIDIIDQLKNIASIKIDFISNN